jgi:hypothetical protein
MTGRLVAGLARLLVGGLMFAGQVGRRRGRTGPSRGCGAGRRRRSQVVAGVTVLSVFSGRLARRRGVLRVLWSFRMRRLPGLPHACGAGRLPRRRRSGHLPARTARLRFTAGEV